MKNIGFLAIKAKYPNDYKTITFVFNDVDTIPIKKGLLDYKTTSGTVKHFYGFTHALGGIVSMTGGDFEAVNGFPNYWAWGFEDNMLNWRVKNTPNMKIDRSQFYKINDPNITQIKGEITRDINRTEFDRYVKKIPEGIRNISGLTYVMNPDANNAHFISIDISGFNTGIVENVNRKQEYDLRKGSIPFLVGPSARRGASMRMHM